MKGIKINFTKDGAVLDTTSSVEGQEAVVQNIMVNIATSAPAPVFEDRGTELLQTFTSNGYVSSVFSQHAANFAALGVLYFSKTFNPEVGNGVSDVNLMNPTRSGGNLTFSLEVKFSEGKIVTTNFPL